MSTPRTRVADPNLDGLRWLVVGGSLAVLVLLADALGHLGTPRSFVEIAVAVLIAAAVVGGGIRLHRAEHPARRGG